MNKDKNLILVTGVTGYIGGRLVPRLLEAGYRVRVLARDASRLQDRSWVEQVEVSEGDVLKPETLENAMHGVSAAYYLIHSMMDTSDFEQRDLTAAQNFGQTARAAGVKRILYLGGLGDPELGSFPAPELPSAHWRCITAERGPNHRIPRGGDCRFWKRVLRNDPLSDRTVTSYDLSEVGLHAGTTDRHPQCDGIPGGGVKYT